MDNNYENREKGYGYVREENYNEDEIDEGFFDSSTFTKFLIFFAFIFSVNFIIVNFIKHSNKEKSKEILYKKTFNNFTDIYPKIEGNTNILNIKELFQNRKLYINQNNITNEYIHFIRPTNVKEDEQYNQILYKNILYNEFPNAKKEGQMNVFEFYNLVNKDKELILPITISSSKEPKISIIIPVTTTKPNLIRSFNSIQMQIFKDIEIIIVDDCTENNDELFKYLYEKEPRLRIFKHIKKMGLWRSRIDGFLYSRGKYILHFDPGDILSDNFVLEDIYYFVSKYNLDTVRFSFSKINSENFIGIYDLENMNIFPTRHLKIVYGRPDYNNKEIGYGNIFNRLFRANIMTKGFDLIEIDILNAYKNIWEDIWWNDLIDRVSFSNLIINKLGYVNFYDRNIITNLNIKDDIEKNNIIREFIYCWYFDYELLPRDANKTVIMDNLRNFNQINNTYNNVYININYVNTYFGAYRHFLYILFKDPFIPDEEKDLIKILYNKVPKRKVNDFF